MTSSSEEDVVIKEENLDDCVENIPSWKPQRRTSAFSPYRVGLQLAKPVTILTNLQRGNIETTQTVQVLPEHFTFHSKAAMGEINSSDFTPDLNVDEVDGNSLTALMWASFYGQMPTVRLLIQNHAKVDTEGENGETALLLGASGGHHEVCRHLLSYGADPNHADHAGNTALMYAAYSDSAHCASELLENGADITATNLEGNSAFNIAVSKGCKKAQIVMERFLIRLLEVS